MDFDLKDKVILVTGSSQGIGYTIAERLHAEGCQVILNGRSRATLRKSAERLQCSAYISADVTDTDQVQNLITGVIARFGRLDGVVCNVGSGQSVAPGEESLGEWQRVFSQNLWSVTNTVEAAKPHLVSSAGSILCISSICGYEVIPNAPVTYSAAKAALHAYIRGIARPLGKHGVRINAIAPGNILFEGSVWEKKLKENTADVRSMLIRDVALEKFGAPEDIAKLTAFLMSSNARFVTGSVWTLDCGQVKS